MTTRRHFLRSGVLSAASIPFLPVYSNEINNRGFSISDSMPEEEYWKQVRKMFPMPADEAYFNTGTLGAQPTEVLERVIDSMRDNAMHIARTDYQGNGPQLLSGYASYDELRKKVAALIHSDYKEISFTQNATFGMNYVSAGLDLKPGDEIINTDQEHGGGRAGWQVKAARYGLVYRQAKIPIPANDPDEILNSIFKEITPRTRVIAVPHIISVYGVVMPVKRICEEARKRGIFTILDGAQAVGHVPVDVKDIGCDAYYGSLHKWLLAPAGSGILYIKNEAVKDIWSTIASYQWENQEDDGFRLMQNGTGNPSLLDGMDAAIDFHNKIGSRKVTARIKYLGDYLRAGLKDIKGVFIESSVHPDMCAGITTYGIRDVKGVDLQNEMWKRKKMQPRAVGEDKIRHSVHIYNSEREIDTALAIVKDMAV
jgi:selenocysteine lyase/cysteine desulfurase